MPSGAGPAAALPRPIEGWQPASFLERGVAVPFTTPQLAGARLRASERGGLELVVPNISGALGVYILPWEGVPALCSPTLHDRRLTERLAAVRRVSPAAVRQAARDVAAEGLAGREAAAAAAAARLRAEEQRRLANYEMLVLLVQQTEPQEPGRVPPEQEARAALEQRARAALTGLAPRFGRSTEALTIMLEELAALFGPIGIGRQAAAARLPLAMAGLAALADGLRVWQEQAGAGDGVDAERVEAAARAMLPLAAAALAEAQALLDNLPALLRDWAADPAAVTRRAGEADWLLDGWQRICLLWQHDDERISRAATLAEMVELVPVLPRAGVGDGAAPRLCRRSPRVEGWRSALAFQDLVARNEMLRTLAPDGPG